jgi:hypothetical protein
MRSIHTEIVIDATPRTVWNVLTDLAGHRSWDPFLVAIGGEPVVGSQLTVQFENGMTFRPHVTEVGEGRAFEWLGKLVFGWLFAGRHRFELVAEGNATRLIHSESFSGILVPLLGGMLRKTERGFVAFNEALKRRVEEARWVESSGSRATT